MRRTKRFGSWRLMLVSAAMVASASGCATMQNMMPSSSSSKTAASGPPPRVEDCAIVAISSPSRYACNGKVYTSYQLAKWRMAEEKRYVAGLGPSTKGEWIH